MESSSNSAPPASKISPCAGKSGRGNHNSGCYSLHESCSSNIAFNSQDSSYRSVCVLPNWSLTIG
jgi:hypothetical protein